MRKQYIRLLTAIAFGLLIQGTLLKVNAAPSSDYDEKQEQQGEESNLSPEFRRMEFAIVLSVTGLAVLIGTGCSIKYNRSSSGKRKLSNSDDSVIDFQDKEVSPQKLQKNSTTEDPPAINAKHELLGDLDKEYREIYLNLQEKVYNSPDFANSPTKDIDTWEVDVQIALTILSESSDNFEKLQKVISQSDRLKEWKDSLPEREYRVKASEYIAKTYNWAENLQQWRDYRVTSETPSGIGSI